jgi:hypothetical protein
LVALQTQPQGRNEEAEKAILLEEEGEPRFPLGSKVLGRLENLERQNRRLKITGTVALALLVLAMAGLAFLLGRAPGGGLVEAERLVIRGKDGLPQARLGEEAGGVRLELLDKAGKARFSLALGAAGEPSLTLAAQNEKALASLGEAAGAGRLDLYDKEGKSRTTLTMAEEAEPGFFLYDQSHRPRAVLALRADGEPGLSLLDQDGVLRVALGSINPEYQAPEAPLVRPVHSLVLLNEKGQPVWHAPWRWRRY